MLASFVSDPELFVKMSRTTSFLSYEGYKIILKPVLSSSPPPWNVKRRPPRYQFVSVSVTDCLYTQFLLYNVKNTWGAKNVWNYINLSTNKLCNHIWLSLLKRTGRLLSINSCQLIIKRWIICKYHLQCPIFELS